MKVKHLVVLSWPTPPGCSCSTVPCSRRVVPLASLCALSSLSAIQATCRGSGSLPKGLAPDPVPVGHQCQFGLTVGGSPSRGDNRQIPSRPMVCDRSVELFTGRRREVGEDTKNAQGCFLGNIGQHVRKQRNSISADDLGCFFLCHRHGVVQHPCPLLVPRPNQRTKPQRLLRVADVNGVQVYAPCDDPPWAALPGRVESMLPAGNN